MSKKITEMTTITSLAGTDWVTGVNNAAADPDKNSKITYANFIAGLATDADVSAVQSNLDAHEATNAATAHPDGVTQTDLTNHKTAANQHPISGVTGLQTALDAKANTADLGTAATRDVGVGAGDVAAGDAPANSTSAHNGDAGAHSGVLSTAAQKAALDANPGLSGVNAVAAQSDIVTTHAALTDLNTSGHPGGVINIPGGVTGNAVTIAGDGTLQDGGVPPGGGGSKHIIQDEGINLTSRTNLNFVGAGVTAEDDASNDATKVTIPGGSGSTNLSNTPTPTQVTIESSSGTDTVLAAASPPSGSNIAGVMTAADKDKLDGLSVAPVDSVSGSNTITASPTTGAVVVGMVNDEASPGNNKVYGTTGAGVKGWKDDPAGGGGWQDGTTITDWGNTEQVLGTLGAGTSAVDLDNGHIITATLTGDRTFNFSSTAAHGATDWSATIATGGNTPTFQFDGVAITTPPDYDISTAGTYVFFFTRNSLGTFVSERRMA